ncbi:uncharacterized protein UTRI_03142_B [Ustilago trichophora]|uniref:SAP domain-containing protein n=1 Tax=Ustilago trichophora TaxID=86804 RepID=A0A5C3E894_9BASI|nr:uncharacterized protein UTRI_03142_B [Ustilago trichophora]
MNGNMLLSPDSLHCLKRKQLTDLCRRFGIKAVGKNTDLIQRLQQYAASNIPSDSPTKGNVPILRHVKRPRQSDSSDDSGSDDQQTEARSNLPYPPLTPRTRQKRVSDLVQAIEEVKDQADDMDTDDDEDESELSQKNTIAFPASSPVPARPLSPHSRAPNAEEMEPTQPLRIFKALPSSSRIASPLSTATILEMSRPAAADANSSLYPDLSTLPLPEGVSSDCLASSSTLPSITSRQFSAAAASVLAEMNARLTAAGRSATSGSLATMSSMGNGTWQNLAASASTQGMSKSRSGRYEIHHERQFKKMDSIVNHYAARRVGGGPAEKSADTSKSSDSSNSASSSSATASNVATMTASTSTTQRPRRVDASTSTRSLAAMARSTSSRKMPVQRRPLPVPPVSQAKLPPSLSACASANKTTTSRQASSTEPPRTKRLRLAVTEDQDALQNTVLEIPPEKKTVVIRVTRPEREGMPYKFSVASSSSSSSDSKTAESGPTRAASSLRKTVIKATKSTFVGGGGSAKKTAASAQAQKRETAFAKQQQQQAAMSRSISSRANLAAGTANRTQGMTPSVSVRNKFTGVVTSAPSTGAAVLSSGAKVDSASGVRKASVAASTSSGGSDASKQGSVSSRLGGSIRSSVSQGLGRAEAARQARLKEIKARTKAALAGFGSQRNVSASTTTTSSTTIPESPQKPLIATPASFSPSVMRPTIASLSRSTANTTSANNGSASLPMLSAITQAPLSNVVASGLQRAATVHAGVGKILTPCLTPRSSSLRHLRRVMRKQQKEADLDPVRIAAAENIAPGAVVPSAVPATKSFVAKQDAKPSIRTVAVDRGSPLKREASPNKYTTLPVKMMRTTRGVGAAARPAGPRAALVATRATTSALNRV